MATHSSGFGKSHGWRNLVGYSLQGCKESDMTEQLHFTSCGIGNIENHSHSVDGEMEVLRVYLI